MWQRSGQRPLQWPQLALAMFLAAAALPRVAAACAGCRNPNLPITRLSTTHLLPGQVRASAVVSATSLNVVHEAGCVDPANPDTCAEVPAQPRYLHDQDIHSAELRAVAEVGITPSWGLEVQLPFRILRTSITYAGLDGAPYVPADPDVHHRNETLTGLADPWVLARWGSALGGTALTARAGATLPLGRTEEDPFVRGAAGQRHQHIQFGNGTMDPLLLLDVSRTVGKIDVSGYGQGQFTLYENRRGFRAGNRFFAGTQAGARIVGTLTGALGLDLLTERPERWQGKVQQDGNLGRTELLGGLSLTRAFGSATASTLVTLVARVPLYRHIVAGDDAPGTLSSPLMVSLIVSRTFGRRAR